MPRDAYISRGGTIVLHAVAYTQNMISSVLLGRSLQVKMLFYSSLFQAGLDRFVIVKEDDIAPQLKGVPSRRVEVVSLTDRDPIRASISAYFESYLGPFRSRKPDSGRVTYLSEFIGDLVTSYRLRRPLLAPLPIPSLAELSVSLPLELFVPIERLFRSITAYESVVAVPILRVSHDQLSIIEEILASDEYSRVETAHATFPCSSSRESCLIDLEKASRALYWKWKDLLRLKSSMIRVINGIPAFIENVFGKDNLFGKAASSVAAPMLSLLSERMAKDDSLIIYDASSILQGLSENLMQQIIANPTDEATIKSRMSMAQYENFSSYVEAFMEAARRKAKGTHDP